MYSKEINKNVNLVLYHRSFLSGLFRKPHDLMFLFYGDHLRDENRDELHAYDTIKMNYVGSESNMVDDRYLYMYESENGKLLIMFIIHGTDERNQIINLLTGIEDKPAEEYLFQMIEDLNRTPKDTKSLIIVDHYKDPDASHLITGFHIYDLKTVPEVKWKDGKKVYTIMELVEGGLYKRQILYFHDCVRYATMKDKALPAFPYLIYRGCRMQRLLRFRKA